MNYRLFSFILFFLLTSCTPLEFFDIAKDFVDGTKKCDGTQNQTEYQELGIYRDDKDNQYNVLVDYENIEDRLYQNLSAKDIAQIASIAIDTMKEEHFTSADNLYKYEFSNFHVVVTHTEEEFAYLNDPAKFKTNKEALLEEMSKVAAFVSYHKQCWDSTDSNFVIVAKNQYLDVSTVVHELGHIISYYEFGDSDGNHNDPNIWYNIGGVNSINGKIMLNYEKITNINVIDEQPTDKSNFFNIMD